jgi:hypothetical protein
MVCGEVGSIEVYGRDGRKFLKVGVGGVLGVWYGGVVEDYVGIIIVEVDE